MGLPFEQLSDGKKDGESGCRTPPSGSSGHQQDCPAAPQKRRAVSQQQQQRRRDYYNGADVDEFFAAHNL